MDYEKLYKEANKKVAVRFGSNVAKELFPDLYESEDERIRKVLLNDFKNNCSEYYCEGVNRDMIIAWLEKQGEITKEWSEMKVANIQTELQEMVDLKQKTEQSEQKPAYTKVYDFHGVKFIPKFAKGDIIKDKKCGEVSTIEDFSYDTGLYTHTYGQFPITIQDNYEIIEQKSAWSEEDENNVTILRGLIYEHCMAEDASRLITWLKSLRPQNRWKPSDLPHWKKSTLPNDNSTGFNSDYFCYKGYNINYKELFEKLPKDD